MTATATDRKSLVGAESQDPLWQVLLSLLRKGTLGSYFLTYLIYTSLYKFLQWLVRAVVSDPYRTQ